MEFLIFILIIAVILIIASPILSVMLFSRVSHLNEQLKTLEKQLFYLQDQPNNSRIKDPAANPAIPSHNNPMRDQFTTTVKYEKYAEERGKHDASEEAIPISKPLQSASQQGYSSDNKLSELKPVNVSDELQSARISAHQLVKSVAIQENNKYLHQEDDRHKVQKSIDNLKKAGSINNDSLFNNQGSSKSTSDASDYMGSLLTWFLNGNPLAKIGVLILLFGLGYLLKYTAGQGYLPIEMRLLTAGIISIGLLFCGWKLRLKQPIYALILQGGAIGAFYLTSFAAFKIYELLPSVVTFILILIVCVVSVALAVMQQALSLAMLASIGGYLAPILLSTGSNNYIGLFSYYLLISGGILGISLWQSWRELNLVGFLFTFGVACMWGASNYQPEYYLSCQLFLIANLVLFGVLTINHAIRNQNNGKGWVDGTLLFGAPFCGFGMQFYITSQWEYGPAFSALAFGAFYLAASGYILKRWPVVGRNLLIGALGLGVSFATLAIPLALSAEWTALAWLLEGLGILWFGLLQKQNRFCLSGSVIMLLGLSSAIFAFANGMSDTSFLLVFGIISITYMIAGALWWHFKPDNSTYNQLFLLVSIISWLFWIVSAADITGNTFREELLFTVDGFLLLYSILSVLLWHALSVRIQWKALGYTVWLLWLAIVVAILSIANEHYNLGLFEYLAEIMILFAALIAAYWLLYQEKNQLPPIVQCGLHLSLFWMIIIFGLTQIDNILFTAENIRPSNIEIMWIKDCLYLSIIAITVTLLCQLKRWPFSTYRHWYLHFGLAPVVVFLAILLCIGVQYDGVIENWRFIPLINPLEETAILSLLILASWGYKASVIYPLGLTELKVVIKWILCGLSILWINSFLLRLLSYYGDVVWNMSALWDSQLIQMGVSLFWSLIALIGMIISRKIESRILWKLGVILLGLVILKLVFVDSTNTESLARIITFIGVGMLFLVIGYLVPCPPKQVLSEE